MAYIVKLASKAYAASASSSFFRSKNPQSVFTISREGVQDADRDGLLGANRSNSLAIARICNNADRPIPRLHTRVEIVNTLSQQQDVELFLPQRRLGL